MDRDFTPIETWPHYYSNGYRIIVANTPLKIRQGLQYKCSFPAKSLLLFPNIPPGTYFHTLNCCMPIDIVALNSLNMVLKVWTAIPGRTKIGPMPRGTTKVLEAPAGWHQTENLHTGSILQI